jgi:HAD superfamily hydrolase (TIGR01549 family)
MHFPPARGVVFDLDGTLIDSGLDFDAMRDEMELPHRMPILEGIASLPAEQAARCWQILDRHEAEGAQRATIMPGVVECLARLHAAGLRLGVLTRNSRRATLMALDRLGIAFDTVMARDDAPPKPDPTGILRICQSWQLDPRQVAMVGDYRFDIEAGRRAGSRTVLFTYGQSPEDYADFPPADFVLPTFIDGERFCDFLRSAFDRSCDTS